MTTTKNRRGVERSFRKLAVLVLCLVPGPTAALACGGDICDDLLAEERHCSTFTAPTPPAGEQCTDERGKFALCVLDSGADICASLMSGDNDAKKAIVAKCGNAPK